MPNPNYLMHKLTGSQINSLVMRNDTLNKLIELESHIDEFYEYGEVREQLEIGLGNAQEEIISQIKMIMK